MRFHFLRPTRRPSGRSTRRSVALLAAAAVVIAACGGDDDPVAAPDDTGVAAPVDTRPEVDGPVATLSPDIPDAYDGGVGPVDVEGTPLPALIDEVNDAAVGQQVPVLVGLDLEGRPIRIDPANDGPTMVVFVAHWCPHCNEEIPKLNRMRAYAQFPEDLEIVAVSTAASPDRPNWPPDEWLNETMKWRYPTMLDGIDLEQQASTAALAYGVTGFPLIALVNGDGTVAARWSGEREPDEILAKIALLGLS